MPRWRCANRSTCSLAAFEFACIKIWWFLSGRHLKWLNTPILSDFWEYTHPEKEVQSFWPKTSFVAKYEIETCPFAVLSSLVMPRSPRKDFVISWKMGPKLIAPFLSYHSLPKPQKLIFLLKFGMQVKFSTSNWATIFWPIWALTSVLKFGSRNREKNDVADFSKVDYFWRTYRLHCIR